MRDTWARAFADGREAALMGGDAEKLLDASARLSLEGSQSVSCFVEAPLLGAPEYDSLVIHNPRELYPGCRIADHAQTQAQAVLDWAAGMEEERPFIHFELDAAGSGTVSGIHCKIEGRPALAEGFFQAAGQPHRTEAFVQAVQNLPRGWYCRYTGVFPGRTTDNTRMEVEPFDEAARRSLGDPAYLRQCFDELGFTAYNDEMLRDAARLMEIDVPISMQFDLTPDGGFLPIFSVLSLYEHIRPDCGPLFQPDGGLTRTCQIYEEMGVSDDRWRMLEQAIFTDRQVLLTERGLEGWARHCLPCCTKAKWVSAGRTPAKFYLLLDALRAF